MLEDGIMKMLIEAPYKMTVFSRDVIRGVRIAFEEREILLDVGTRGLKPCLSNARGNRGHGKRSALKGTRHP